MLSGWLWLWLSPGAALADPAGSSVEHHEHGELIPPHLVAQVAPVYPAAARAERLHGDVNLVVSVDATGAVVDTVIESGPEVFHASAREAAAQLRFEPAERNGEPVAARVRVSFHFAPPEPVVEDEPVAEIVVHADDPDLEDTRARTTLDAQDLERAAGQDLAETVSAVPGVRMAGGTSDAAKPIIRGQQERRLLVLYDGVRHESQKWGPDHATEIDPFAAGSISVIRGAAGARYGPDAIGGVILVQPPPLRVDPGVGGTARLAFATNGLRPYGALRLDAVPEAVDQLSLRIEANYARGASRVAPDYVLGNTGSEQLNLGASAGWRWDHGQLRASFHHHDFRAGIFYGVQNSTPADFEAGLDAAVPTTADLWTVRYPIDRPYQDVTHDIASLHATTFGGWGTLEAIYAFQLNRRREFEQVREAVTGPQYDFTLRTHSVDLMYGHPVIGLPFADLEGSAGVQGSFQENVFAGFTLIPNHRSFAGGAFVVERLSLRRVDLEAGARYDRLHRSAFLDDDDFGRHVRRDTLDPATCDTDTGARTRCPSAWDTGSVSVGSLLHVVPETLDLKVDLSTASRFPNIDEQYLAGSAPSFPVFALGFPDLGVETARGGSLTAGLRLQWIEAEVAGYAQHIADYIYFAPDLGPSGEPSFEVTIRGTWPRYGYRPIDAGVVGTDGSLQLGPDALVGVDLRGSLVRIRDMATGDHLIGTPPDQLHGELVFRPHPPGPVGGIELAATTDLVAEQSRVDPEVDFAPPPPGYALFGLRGEAEWMLRTTPVRVGLTVTNLLDTAYREYTSLLRYYADQPGRDVRIHVSTDF